MEKRKGGIYAQWYVIVGYNKHNKHNILTNFLIYFNQAKTYPQAVKYWKEHWGKNGCRALYLRNAEPFDSNISLAC